MADSAADLGLLPEWDLTDLYSAIDGEDIQSALTEARNTCSGFAERWKGTLSAADAGSLADAVADYEAIHDRLGRIMSFAALTYTRDTSDPKSAKFYGDMQEQITACSAQLLFFELELNALEENALDTLIGRSDRLAAYAPWLKDIRKEKPHQLSEELEQLFVEKSVTASGAWNRLFDETIAAMRFSVDGEELAIEPTLNLLQDPDGEKRKNAAKALSTEFSNRARTFTLITNTLAKDKDISDRWRGFEDIASSRHLSNRVEQDVVDALVRAVQDAYPKLSHRYYQMKAKWLGLPKLQYWDRNAPLPDNDRRVIPWSDARDTVLSAYEGFSPEMARIAGRFFDSGWIDAPVRPGKAPGAFAHPTVPSAHPYVLINYQGKTRDVMTLAHELGHGVHQVLAAEQGALMAPTPLTLAETASVFGEMLTFRSLLDRTTDEKQRKTMLAGKVEDMINTVVRQIAFYTFERKVHTARKDGELTTEDLNRFWLEVQAESLGPAIEASDDYAPYWVYIPHFIHSPFYVYAYAFGDCLVNSLYAVYQNAEPGFVEKYFDMLRAGGTKHHSELLAPFGLDAREPAFWSMGLSMLEGFIDELEKMDA